ncbi:hypothetical protein IMSHALPRED_007737 [Imshaugia aleurites]|uniref:F-box domain-containing protein n=1 Tax=Imshaugia aleurites TaxID=172621 RepID=A0A8H3FWQ7_9LECA|nr:hypothetical protein IMSHALPRED_007737 [Imshaugia aleurites]
MYITDLANELLLHILQSCPTISSLLALASACKHLHSIFAHNKLPLLYQSFEAEYGPSHDAIRLVTYNSSQLAHIPRPAPPQSMALLKRLVEVGQVAEKWAAVYPSQKWTGEESANRRLLSSQERRCLRRACYRIWLYNMAFHTPQHARTGRVLPQVVRTRAQVLRPWSGEQLAEMLDLHAIFRAILHSHICPSNGTVLRRHKQRFPDDPFPLLSTTKATKYNDPLVGFHQALFHSTPHFSSLSTARNHSPYGATVEGWGDEIAQYYVVEDMLKLDPGQLMHLFESLTGPTGSDAYLKTDYGFGSRKATVEQFVTALGDWFENNGETLVETICFVVGERGGDGRELGELVEGGLEGICRRELGDDVE